MSWPQLQSSLPLAVVSDNNSDLAGSRTRLTFTFNLVWKLAGMCKAAAFTLNKVPLCSSMTFLTRWLCLHLRIHTDTLRVLYPIYHRGSNLQILHFGRTSAPHVLWPPSQHLSKLIESLYHFSVLCLHCNLGEIGHFLANWKVSPQKSQLPSRLWKQKKPAAKQ